MLNSAPRQKAPLEQNPYSAPKASFDSHTEKGPSPAIWNPNAAANWSLLLTPIFGAILHMKNWEAMGRPERATASMRWAIGVAVAYLALIACDLLLPAAMASQVPQRLVGFGLLIAWYFVMAKDQMDFVAYTYGKDFVRRGWATPMLCAAAVYAALFVFVFVYFMVFAGSTVASERLGA
jgi:hypothetical protein